MNRRSKKIAGIIVLGLSLYLLAPVASASESIRMIAVDASSASALWVKVFIEYFIPEVDRRLAENDNYDIDWNPAFGGTIAKPKGVLDSLQHDLADIGIVTTPYHADKVPFHNLPYATPFVSNDVGLIARTMSGLANKYPIIKKAWEDYELHYLTVAGSIDTYTLVMTDPIETFDDLRGRKIGGVGSNMLFLTGSGSSAVTSDLIDWYNNMSTGLLDGVIVWPEAVVAYKLYEVAPYILDIQFGGATSKAIVVNQRTWDRLPEEVRQVLQETAEDYRDELARETDRVSARSRAEFVERGGTIISVNPEQRQKWASRLPGLSDAWIDAMERKGLPGREILSDYMHIMRDNGQPIMRHWGEPQGFQF
ncbi:MAG: C4-dicarboxylate TRAP transporter substrate-binding protein [Proteobacteria bacterium]|nr:C4-dicarboxylate TRAP transporter substrate-binding protein [Pseudomonadota bacterium]